MLGSHHNGVAYLASELINFYEDACGAGDLVQKDGNAIVIVTGDHGTGGGMSTLHGAMKTGTIETGFTTKGHTGVVIPMFTYGRSRTFHSNL